MFHIMSFAFLLLCGLVSANEIKVRTSPFEYCDQLIRLGPGRSIHISSPNYPEKYMPKSSCRFTITASLDHQINAQCNIDIYQGVSNCTTELFYISTEGDRNLNYGQYFCGEGYIQQKSFFRTIVIAYTSHSNGNEGSFNCLVKSIPQQCECGWTIPFSKPRFDIAEEVKINEYPFAVGFISTVSGRLFCGGTIISHRYIMSAATCFKEYIAPNEIQVRVGSHSFNRANDTETGTYYILFITQHPMYDSKTRANDIALVMTRSNIEWSFAVGPACLPFHFSSNPFLNEDVSRIGWPTEESLELVSGALQKVSVKVTTNNDCKSMYSDLDDSQICTDSPLMDPCLFDAGNPIVLKKGRLFVIAIAGVTHSCGIPTVHTRVTTHLNWISNLVGQGLCLKSD